MVKQSLIPPNLAEDLSAIAEEGDRLHESFVWSAQIQFEQMKLWRGLNLFFGVPAAVLAAIAGGTGLAADSMTDTPAILALVSAAFGAALTTLNPSRRMSQAQSAASAYLELQTAARQFLTIHLLHMDREAAFEALGTLTVRRDEVNRTADPPGRYAYWRASRNIKSGGQNYKVDVGRAG